MLERILDCIGLGHGSAKELADALGINPQIITNWRCGSSKSYRKYLKQIAAYYHVSVGYLLGNEEKPTMQDDEQTEEQLKIALFGGDGTVTDEMWDEVKNFAEFIKNKRK